MGRGLAVMLDSDLAKLYGVATKALVQAMKCNAALPLGGCVARTFRPAGAILTRRIFTLLFGPAIAGSAEVSVVAVIASERPLTRRTAASVSGFGHDG